MSVSRKGRGAKEVSEEEDEEEEEEEEGFSDGYGPDLMGDEGDRQRLVRAGG